MKTRSRLIPVALLGALLGLNLLLFTQGIHAQDIIIIGGKLQSGIFGPAPEQTARMNVVNVERAAGALACAFQVTFYDALGEIVKRSRHRLTRGKSGFAEVSFEEIVNPPPRAGRKALSAEIVGSAPPEGDCVASLEVYDQATGRTAVFIGNPNEIPGTGT